MWLKFIDLTPVQQVVAQRQLKNHSETIPSLKLVTKREFLIVDGKVKGSRIFYTDKDKKLFESLGIGKTDVRSKTDLKDWKSTPTPFSITKS